MIAKEEIENYITELESMFELSELEEHSRNILKVGIYINKLQQRIDKAIEYLETATIDPQSMRHYRNCLLEILKGENNE